MSTDKVLLLDAEQRSALACARSLGRRGVFVVTADERAKTLAGASKYCRERFVYPSPYDHPDEFIARVREESAKRRIGIIFPMTDITTSLVLQRQQELREFVIPFASFEVFESLTDKCRLLELAGALEVPVPRTYCVREPRDLTTLLPRLAFPVVLKPYRSRIWSGSHWIVARVRYANSAEQLASIVAESECFRRHPFLVQEYIRGEGRGIFALYEHARPLALFAHKRLRERPPSGGVSVLCESIEVHPRLCDLARRILDRVGWHGIAMVEFKVSAEGIPYLMEVNARFWGSLQLAIDAGVDFPWLLYQLARNEPVQEVKSYKIGIRNRWLLGDLAHLYRVLLGNRVAPRFSLAERWRSLAGFLNFFQRNTRYEVNRWDDVGPFLHELQHSFRGQRGMG